jgi:nucleotidyltransferase/DNA polymerase involved in DNA repair
VADRVGDPARGALSGAEGCNILHVDMDSFFASVEVLDDPSLAGKPVIVGGSGSRGVVASCTYEARAYGIHSAMPSVHARRLCPHAIFVAGRYDRYAQTSEQLHSILRRFTPLVEGIGLDEAFLDVSGARRLLGSASEIAWSIRSAVRHEMSLACCVGVARTKLLAKLASRAAKPKATAASVEPGHGVVVVRPDEEISFLRPLPIRALWGVGPATAARLAELGVVTVGDLVKIPDQTVQRVLGASNGRHLCALARGEDDRAVEPDRGVKSVGHEETFAVDLYPPPRAAHGGRGCEQAARGMPEGQDRHVEDPLRRPPDDHPLPDDASCLRLGASGVSGCRCSVGGHRCLCRDTPGRCVGVVVDARSRERPAAFVRAGAGIGRRPGSRRPGRGTPIGRPRTRARAGMGGRRRSRIGDPREIRTLSSGSSCARGT